jgi:hypothetical protein
LTKALRPTILGGKIPISMKNIVILLEKNMLSVSKSGNFSAKYHYIE